MLKVSDEERPMTIREWAEDYCCQRGMFRDQAKAVVDAVMADNKASEAMQGRWDDNVAGYSEQLLAVLMLGIDRQAVTYLEANCPMAWFKPMFDGTA